MVDEEDKGIQDALLLWAKMTSDDQIKAQIRAREKFENDKRSEMAIIAEQGRIQGIQEERKRNEEKLIQTVINMKSKGFDISLISEMLGISEHDIDLLLKDTLEN